MVFCRTDMCCWVSALLGSPLFTGFSQVAEREPSLVLQQNGRSKVLDDLFWKYLAEENGRVYKSYNIFFLNKEANLWNSLLQLQAYKTVPV